MPKDAPPSPAPSSDESNSVSSEQLHRARNRALIEFKHNCDIYGDVSKWYARMSLVVFWLKMTLALLGTLFGVIAPGDTSSEIIGPIVTSLLGALTTANRHFRLDVKSNSYSKAYRELANAYETAAQDLENCPDEDIDLVLQQSRQILNDIRGQHEAIPGWAVRLSVNKLNNDLI